MIYVAIIICFLYGILILYFSKGIDRLKEIVSDQNQSVTPFSILVPFRNEASSLPGLLESITALDYPRSQFELIMINDASSDSSESVVNRFREKHPTLHVTLIDNKKQSSSPKKDAIQEGIARATYDWIITTDADCVVPKTWLSAFNTMIKEQAPKMIAAPVSYLPKNGFLHKFQLLDFLSLQGITMGSFGMQDKKLGHPFLCNGANLSYQKKSFKEVNGYEGNEHIASGDDVFLLEKMLRKFPNEIQFIKSRDAIVLTASKDSFRDLIQQRVRWAAKTAAYKSFFTKGIGVLVFMTSLSMVSTFILASLGQLPWLHVGFLFVLKFNIDFILLYKTSQFFEQQEVMKSYFISSLLHPFYTVLVVILSLKKSYTWKDRTY